MIKLGVVMDPIGSINFKKDSTLDMLLEASRRGWQIYYFEPHQLYLRDAIPFGIGRDCKVYNDPNKWFDLGDIKEFHLGELDVILMRKDPPFNEDYIYTTYILEHAERLGALVVNKPQSLRDANEKLFTTYFPQCCPPNIVTSSRELLYEFWQELGDIVCKPLDSMGGKSIFRLRKEDVNANVIFETLTKFGSMFIMAQAFIPEITKGDKRILLINGEVIPYALARIPQGSDWRGNLAVGAKGEIQPLTERDLWICEQIKDDFKRRGLYFVGIDVIGDFLTEINVTSPTGIQELTRGTGINISGKLMDVIEAQMS